MNFTKENPIGFFDSGIGGTSIWKEVHKLLPNENTIYLADSKNAPYGDKTKNKIIEYCIKNTEILLTFKPTHLPIKYFLRLINTLLVND